MFSNTLERKKKIMQIMGYHMMKYQKLFALKVMKVISQNMSDSSEVARFQNCYKNYFTIPKYIL